jgi:hypothetical protein
MANRIDKDYEYCLNLADDRRLCDEDGYFWFVTISGKIRRVELRQRKIAQKVHGGQQTQAL